MRSPIGIWLALCFLGAVPALAGQPGKGGNAALMEAWQARQQELSQKIAQRLFEQNRIPRDGTVRYTARVKPDASAPGGVVLSVDSLTVTPAGSGPGTRVEGREASQAMDMVFSPRDPSLAVRLQSLDVPVGTEVTGTLTIKDGTPVPEAPAEPAPPPTPAAPPEEPSWWQQFRDALGF